MTLPMISKINENSIGSIDLRLSDQIPNIIEATNCPSE